MAPGARNASGACWGNGRVGQTECLPRADKNVCPTRHIPRSAVLPILVVSAAVMLQIGGVKLPVVGRGWARFDPARWPVALLPQLDEINRSAADGTPIFNDLNFGGFLIYHEPRLRVFVDDRCSLYGTEFLRAYDHARREDPAEIERWRRQYGFRYALVETGGPFDRYLSVHPRLDPAGPHARSGTLYDGDVWAFRPRYARIARYAR